MKVIKCLVFLIVTTPLFAAPKFAEADKWRRELQQAADQNTSMFRQADKRPEYGRKLNDLAARASSLFGSPIEEPFGACVKAIDFYQSAWTAQQSNLSKPNSSVVANQTSQSFAAGINYWACRLAIDELEKPLKAKK